MQVRTMTNTPESVSRVLCPTVIRFCLSASMRPSPESSRYLIICRVLKSPIGMPINRSFPYPTTLQNLSLTTRIFNSESSMICARCSFQTFPGDTVIPPFRSPGVDNLLLTDFVHDLPEAGIDCREPADDPFNAREMIRIWCFPSPDSLLFYHIPLISSISSIPVERSQT